MLRHEPLSVSCLTALESQHWVSTVCEQALGEYTVKSLNIGLLLGCVLGVGFGFAAGIFAFPYLFPPPELNEQVIGKDASEIIGRGQFIHANPADPVHFGRGAVTLYADLLHLDADFEVGPGPKYHVYLVPLARVDTDTAVDQTMFVDLGRLKAFSGGQNYPIPEGLDPRAYPSVVIWCEQFDVLISPASLSFDGADRSAVQ
jgi:hypothetical protein